MDEASDARTDWCADVQSKLLAWYDSSNRDLPWRRSQDPYAVLVSEIMLVQTTVSAVIPFYERFLRQFPSVQALADADEEAVLKAWEGLGYYRRARQLQAAARRVVNVHAGKFPHEMAEIRALPGVGRYIAGAVASIAFAQPEPILEANSQRVLARLIACEGDLSRAMTQKRLWLAAGRLVPSRRPGDFNQALIDLGALVCQPQAPKCLLCPVQSRCRAFALGNQESLPVKTPRPKPIAGAEICVLIRGREGVLITQRGKGVLWENFWEFPTVWLEGSNPSGRGKAGAGDEGLAADILGLTGLRIRLGEELGRVGYTVTRHRMRLTARAAFLKGGVAQTGPGIQAVRWVSAFELKGLPLASATRGLLRSLPNDCFEAR